MFEILNQVAKEHELDGKYKITLECTHHGPLIDKPCVFIEVGATDEEWNDRRAAFVLAKTISRTIEEFEENPYREVAIGIGGPHYCPNFNKIQLKSNVAISHVIPGYALPISEEMIEEAVEKTEENIEFAVLDWKGSGKAKERDRIVEILEKNYIRWKKTSEVEK
jgi:D-aminoacyl-tRNA deacylase